MSTFEGFTEECCDPTWPVMSHEYLVSMSQRPDCPYSLSEEEIADIPVRDIIETRLSMMFDEWLLDYQLVQTPNRLTYLVSKSSHGERKQSGDQDVIDVIKVITGNTNALGMVAYNLSKRTFVFACYDKEETIMGEGDCKCAFEKVLATLSRNKVLMDNQLLT